VLAETPQSANSNVHTPLDAITLFGEEPKKETSRFTTFKSRTPSERMAARPAGGLLYSERY
jgi:hypothetical protein